MMKFYTKLLILIALFISKNNELYSQSRIWGTTSSGFDAGFGGVFSIGTGGEDYFKQHYFGENPGHSPVYAELIRANDGKFYGTATNGGYDDNGVLFQFDTAGRKYKALVIFNKKNGSYPFGGVIQAGNSKLYGMTQSGGLNNHGVIYSYDIDSAIFRVLHHFKDTTSGRNPYGEFIEVRNGIFYAMTETGGKYNRGVIFSYNVQKDTVIKHFDFNDTLGARPRGTLALVGGKLYGATREGGTNTGRGAVFSFDTATNVVTRHYSFGSQTGENPIGKFIMANNGKLYGVATNGGLTPGNMSGTSGVVYAIDTSNNSFSVIRQFSGVASLANPVGSLVKMNNGKLYGVSSYHINSPNAGGVYSIVPNATYTVERSFGVNDNVFGVTSPLTALANGRLIGLSNRGGTHINRGVIYMFDTGTKAPTALLEFGTSLNGAIANGALMRADNGKIYGTTREGGTQRRGVLFSIDPFTSEQKVLHNFVNTSNGGYFPNTKLVQAPDGKLYGVTSRGGNNDDGTIFTYDTATNSLTRLYSFSSGNGAIPVGALLLDSNGILYGVTMQGGSRNHGVLYSFNPSGNSFTKLADFTDTIAGQTPNGYLTSTKDGSILGTCRNGGMSGAGTIFRFNPKDTTLVRVNTFIDSLSGYGPRGGLLAASNGRYYGTAEYGGNFSRGTLFEYNDSSRTAKIVYHFKDAATGEYPQGNLIEASNGYFYGMTNGGGTENLGTAFRFRADSSRLERIYSFSGTDGSFPGFCEMLEVFSSFNTWTGVVDSLWTNPDNWGNKQIPAGITGALIPAHVTRFPLINAPVTVNYLTVDSGARVEISKFASLTVNRKLQNDGEVIIKDDGHLLPGPDYEQIGTGIFRVFRKNYDEDSSKFQLWSSPITPAKEEVLPGALRFKMDFTSGGTSFADFKQLSSGDTLSLCHGYRTAGDTAENTVFIGWANNGDLEIIVKADTNGGYFNLLGNPYPGSINAGGLMDLNDGVLDRVIYIKMPPSADTKYSADGLVSINDNGATGTGLNKDKITLNNSEIGTARGFFVIALKSDTVKFDNSLRNGNPATLNSIFDPLRIWLTLKAPDSFYSQTLCVFSPMADTGYDIGQDALKFGPSPSLSLHSLMQGKPMSIQAYPQVDSLGSMPLGLKTTVQGNYQLLMNDVEQADYYHLFLDDLDSNKSYNLKTDTAILSLSANQTFNSRFRLRVVKILPEIKVLVNGVCLGDTAVFEAKNPMPGFRYQWELEGTASAGDTLVLFKTVKGGKLILRQFDKDGNPADSRDTGVIIHPLPQKPALQRNIATIAAGGNFSRYEWFRNNLKIIDSARSSLVLGTFGNYFCRVSDSNQCSINSDTLQIPKIEILEIFNNVCAGDTAVFEVKAPETGFRYQWLVDGQANMQDTLNTFLAITSSALRLVKFHASGYRDTSELINVVVNPLPLKPALKYTPGILDADTGFTAYQWFRNQLLIPNARGQVHIFRQKGAYFCEVKNVYGCRNYSDTITIEGVEIFEKLNNPCLGDTAIFEVNQPKQGFRYRWLKNGVSSPQDTNLDLRVSTAAAIVLIETNSFGYRDTAMAVNATFRALPLVPLLTLNDAQLDAGNNYDGYQWTFNGAQISGGNASVQPVTQNGNYNCIVENSVGCTIAGIGFSVTGTSIIEMRNNVCSGDSAQFGIDDPKSGFQYQWYVNGSSAGADTGQIFKTPAAGDLYFIETNRFGYADTSASVSVRFKSLPPSPLIRLENGGLNAGGGYRSYQWLRNTVWQNGETDSILRLKSPGNYSCTVTNADGCRNTGNSAEIRVVSLFEVKNSVCEDDTAVFSFSNAKPGFSYEWFINGISAGTGDSIFTTTQNGNVSVRETNAFGYLENSNVIQSVIYAYPTPPPLVFMNGKLDAGAGFDAYRWFKNNTETAGIGRDFAPDGPGTYHARVGNNGCLSTGSPWIFDKVEINTLLNEVCEGDEAKFEVLKFYADFSYQWILNNIAVTGATLPDFNSAVSGNLRLVQWHPAGYRDTSAVSPVVIYPLPAKPVIQIDTMKLSVPAGYHSYQWYRNSVEIPGANTRSYEVTMSGDYFCMVANIHGCSEQSDTAVFSSVWISPKHSANNIRLYPNPAHDRITIASDLSAIHQISIADITGKVILIAESANDQPTEMDIEILKPGVYQVIVNAGGILYHLRFVKN